MNKLQLLVVATSCAALLFACSKEDTKQAKQAEKTPEQAAAGKADPATPPAASPGESGLGSLGALLGGKKLAPPAAKGGGLLGGIGAGGGAATPTPAATGEAAPSAAPAVEKMPATSVAPPAAGGAAPGCQKVAEHVGKILEQEMAKAKSQGLDMEIPPEMVAQMVPMVAMVCQQMNWSAEAQACVLSAKDSASIDKCESLMPDGMGGMGGVDIDDNQMADNDTGDLELPDMSDVPSTPTPSGDAECDQLSVTLVAALLSELPADQKQAIEPMKVTLQNEIAKECASTPWPKAVRSCLRQAKTQADMEKCASQM